MELNAKFVIKFNDGTEKEIGKDEAKALQNLLNGVFDRYPYYPYYPFYPYAPTYPIYSTIYSGYSVVSCDTTTNAKVPFTYTGAADTWPLGHCVGGTSVEVKG